MPAATPGAAASRWLCASRRRRRVLRVRDDGAGFDPAAARGGGPGPGRHGRAGAAGGRRAGPALLSRARAPNVTLRAAVIRVLDRRRPRHRPVRAEDADRAPGRHAGGRRGRGRHRGRRAGAGRATRRGRARRVDAAPDRPARGAPDPVARPTTCSADALDARGGRLLLRRPRGRRGGLRVQAGGRRRPDRRHPHGGRRRHLPQLAHPADADEASGSRTAGPGPTTRSRRASWRW